MRKLTLSALVFLALLSPVYAQESSIQRSAEQELPDGQQRMNEAFIMMSVTSSRGNSFYRVMMDNDERPYVNIRDVFEQYFDFAGVSCDPTRQYCQGRLMPEGNTFWIDGKQREYGDEFNGPGGERLQEGDFVVQDGVCWLRYDILQKWLPLSAYWDLKAYYLSIIPEFKLKFEREKMRDQEIERALNSKADRAIIEATDPIRPDHVFRPEFKYHISARKYPEQPVGADMNYDLNVDVLRGTAQIGGPVMYQEKLTTSRPYWLYRLKDQGWFYLMEGGDTIFEEASLLLPNVSAINGFRFDSRNIEYGEGKINIDGRGLPNTKVDLYRDGFYMGTTVVGNDGRYSFANIIVTGKSHLVAKLYFPDGSEEIREIPISEDNGLIIPQGEFFERIFTGETIYGRMNYASLRYGLFKDATIGLSPMFFPSEDHASVMADLSLRPFSELNFLGQVMFTGKNIDRAFRINTTVLYPNFIQIEHRYYNPDTPDFLTHYREFGEYWAGRHSLGYGRLQFINEYEQYSDIRKVNSDIMFTLYRWLRPFVGAQAEFPKGLVERTSFKTGIDFLTSERSLLEVYRTWAKPYSTSTISFMLRNAFNVGGWDISALLNIPDKGAPNTFRADIMYRLTKNISIGTIVLNKYFGFRVNLDGVWTPEPGPATWYEFGSGTVAGKLMAPAEEGGEPVPVQDALVTVSTRSAITDEKGEYQISGISTYQKLMARVDASSIDASIATEKPFEVLYLRPGTYINWNPKIVSTAGFDGMIVTGSELPPNAEIQVFSMPEDRLVATAKVEEDGFFIVDKVTAGNFQLRLKGKTMNIVIPAGQDWVSDVRWDIDTNEISKMGGLAQPRKAASAVKSPESAATHEGTKPPAAGLQPKEDRYYTIEGRPLYIGEAQGPTRGIEGNVIAAAEIPEGIFVEAVSLDTGKVVSRGTLESDGFFIISKLTSGKYELRLKGARKPPAPIKVEIPKDQDWVSGIRWNWQNQ